MDMKILVLNAGSSSQKSSFYALGEELPEQPPEPLWQGQIDWTHHQGSAEIKVKTAQGAEWQQELASESRAADTLQLLKTLWDSDTQVIQDPSEIDIVGHRVVHGGQDYRDSTIITPEVKATIDRLAVLAPAHNPANLQGIEAIEQVLGTAVPQVAVFDTAFHAHIPPAAAVYPGLYEWLDQGIRRYGFHGISHQYCAQRAASLLGQDLQNLRLITCHLGNGCSLAAIQDGHSIDTTMGFTPLDGLMMGTRSGAVDPGILIHLMRQNNATADQLDQMLNKSSGLKGISGISGDLRQVLEAIDQGNDRAQLAFDIFIHRLRSCIGSMLASLGGLDVLVFTAGIGENNAKVRAAACQAFEFLGLKLDPAKNVRSPDDQEISAPDSSVRVLVIHTHEEWAIAQQCWQLYPTARQKEKGWG
jgi:acetate kinase